MAYKRNYGKKTTSRKRKTTKSKPNNIVIKIGK